ncbi:MAG: secondary thiamine-phosphate synthase enzyme YjbQ [Candidatus Altiarchaeota archaeon]|nr:secondary thiamine-phosphate synthase enzyme YjbQ [Candidatus Altiarchaeota archaeon]
MEFAVETYSRECFVEVTDWVSKIVEESGVREGLCLVYVPHTTCGLTVNENADPDVVKDILKSLGDIVKDIGFRHSEGNSIAHVKSSLMGCNQTFPVENGKIVLGTWQGVYLTEFDGPRKRKVKVEVIGSL